MENPALQQPILDNYTLSVHPQMKKNAFFACVDSDWAIDTTQRLHYYKQCKYQETTTHSILKQNNKLHVILVKWFFSFTNYWMI